VLSILLYKAFMLCSSCNFTLALLAVLSNACITQASAMPQNQPFPDILFADFAAFIGENFSSKISLATALMVLLSMTENTQLLNLHARQQNPVYKTENKIQLTGWIKALSRAMIHRLNNNTAELFKSREYIENDQDYQIKQISKKLDSFVLLLGLTSYHRKGKYKKKLLPISHEEIKPVLTICPQNAFCMDRNCKDYGLSQFTRTRDIPLVSLIKDNIVFKEVPVLTAKCRKCETSYFADHERFLMRDGSWNHCYLNSAQYLKLGQSLWADRKFSYAVVNGVYNFHASAAAYTQFWNDCQAIIDSSIRITRRQVWQAFVQESIRTVAAEANINLELPDGLNIGEVTREAFEILGNKGIIQPSNDHSCSECTQPYKSRQEFINNDDPAALDPAALVGNDENENVPRLEGQYAELSEQETVAAQQEARQRANRSTSDDMDVDYAPVTMVVVDGIVMGPTHCAYDGCEQDLTNARGGSFCPTHESLYGTRCHIRDCQNTKVTNTQACVNHQREWKKHQKDHSRSTLSGVRRMLQRPNENMPWQMASNRRPHQPHDDDDDDSIIIKKDNYFSPSRFYCVEIICKPCGCVVAWKLFDKAESPTKILNFLDSVFPTLELRPNYICIDKGCKVLRTSIANESWETWKKTSRFIVDSYHYINHRTTDYLCRKWCNPAPLNGSAPNLVVVDEDKKGKKYYKRAFNTQACEQLNSWLGGYDPILKRMKIGNFNWFIHTMLFWHSKKVIRKAEDKKNKENIAATKPNSEPAANDNAPLNDHVNNVDYNNDEENEEEEDRIEPTYWS
jgi:hypothetical protein